MRESTFEDYLIYHDHGFVENTDEPFLGLEPDGFFEESSLSEPFYLDRDEEEWSKKLVE
jgi:hypothetical protein